MNRLSKNFVALVICAVVGVGMVSAQQSQQAAIAKITNAIEHIDQLFESQSPIAEVQVDALQYDISQNLADIEAWSNARRDVKKAETGLDLTGGYDRKFGSGTDDPFDEYYSYANRLSLVLTWNILNSGFIGSKNFNERVDLQSSWKELNENNYRTIAMINDASELQSQIIDAHYNKLYEAKTELYNELIEFQDYLQQTGNSTIFDKAEFELKLAICKASIKPCEVTVDNIFDIDSYIALQTQFSSREIETLIQSNHIINEAAIEGKLIDNEASSINYWNDARIAPYAKVQHYSASNFSSELRTVGHVGVAITMPLSSEAKRKRREAEARLSLHNNLAEQQSVAIKGELEIITRELNSNLQLLNISAEVVEIHKAKIQTAKQMYASKQLSIQNIAMQYLTLLDSQINVLDLIAAREALKTRLLLLNNRN